MAITVIVLIVAVFALFRFVIGLSVVGGDSMVPNLLDQDIVVYSRLSRDYQPGDIIAMRVPSGEYYVKRVIATGGDIVEVRNGHVRVNGVEIEDPWGYGETRAERGTVIYPYPVREGNVFVLGDNRRVSMDSRTFGEVNIRQIRGRIVLRAGIWYLEPVGNAATWEDEEEEENEKENKDQAGGMAGSESSTADTTRSDITNAEAEGSSEAAEAAEEEPEEEEKTRNRRLLRLCSLIPAIASVIIFIRTEDMTNAMRLVDGWTILMIFILAVQFILAFLCRKKKQDDDEEEEKSYA